MKVQFHNAIHPQLNYSKQDKDLQPQKSNYALNVLCCGLYSRPDLVVHPSLISFGMLKKSKLDGYQLACANKFKAPLDKFNSSEDFNAWASEKLEEKTDLEQYKNEEPLVQKAVKEKLSEWKEYLYSDNLYKNNPALSLIIFDAITKDISPDTHAFPPELHKGVLSSTIGELKDATRNNPTSGFDFNKRYQNNLRLEYTKDTEDVGDGNFEAHWVRIKSKENDPENFEENVKKLKALSCNTWCTRSTHAEEYLKEGDFYVYLEDNKPKVGIRLNGYKVAEIEGEKNNQKIPLNYLDTIKTFIKKENLKGADEEIKKAELAKKEIAELRVKYADDFKNHDYKNILKELDFIVRTQKDGKLTLYSYEQPDRFTFEELGLDENDLLKQINRIDKDANFKDSKVTDLGSLKYIGGDAYFGGSSVVNLGKLEKIQGDANFRNSKVKDLGGLKHIGLSGVFAESKVENLGSLEYIGGAAYFSESKIKDLANLKEIGWNADFTLSGVENLGKLTIIGGDAEFSCSNITNLANLEHIRGNAIFRLSAVTNLGKLKNIGGNAKFQECNITSLNNLETIGGSASFENSKITDLGALLAIGKNASFGYSSIEDLGNLQEINGYADFRNSKVNNLKNLNYIGGTAYFDNIKEMTGNVNVIGGEIYSNDRPIEKGNVHFLRRTTGK